MTAAPIYSSARRRACARANLLIEALEGRLLLNARYIVPVGVPFDNATTFVTLQAALSTTGLTAGDTIQIESGSAPGNVTAVGPGVSNLTIRGDPNAALASIPQFTISTTFIVAPGQGTFTLSNVNLGLVANGTDNGGLLGKGNLVISGSSIVNFSSGTNPLIFLGGPANVVTNSTLVNDDHIGSYISIKTPAGGSNNRIANNTFMFNGPTGIGIWYADGAAAAVTDQIVSNSFYTNPDAETGLIEIGDSVSGVTIQGNTFTSKTFASGIYVGGIAQNITIRNNTFHIPGGDGVMVEGGGAGTTCSAVIANNQIDMGTVQGIGIHIILGSTTTSVMNVRIEGNDLHDNLEGVRIAGNAATTPATGIDLGGGTRGSLGGNDFRSFTSAASISAGAIVISNLAAGAGTIGARRNTFAAGVTIGTVVLDAGSNLNLANPLTGNAAFVQTLYADFLKRTGDTTSGNDAGYWINAISGGSMTAAQAAQSISHSAEALGTLVDGLYQRYLGRAPDAGGRSYFISVLAAPGLGTESMINQLVTSAEFSNQFGSSGNFIQAIYTRLLGRLGGNSEVSSWVATLATASRSAVVASILGSAEFRGGVVKQLYGFAPQPSVATASIFLPLLHRGVAPSAGEINFWVNSGSDILSIDTAFAQTGEYFSNG